MIIKKYSKNIFDIITLNKSNPSLNKFETIHLNCHFLRNFIKNINFKSVIVKLFAESITDLRSLDKKSLDIH